MTTNKESISVDSYIAYVTVNNDNYVIVNNNVSSDTKNFTIIPNVITSLSDMELTYTGNEFQFEVNKFYTIKFEDAFGNEIDRIINAGEYAIVASLIDTDNFLWSTTNDSNDLRVTLTVRQLDITSMPNIEVDDIPMQSYTSEEVEPKPVIRYLGEILTEGEDYELSYSNNIEASSDAKVTVTGIGNFKGKFTVKFTIYSTVLKLTDEYQDLEYRVFIDSANTAIEAEHNYYDKNRRIVLTGISRETTVEELINMFDPAQRSLIKFYNASSRIVSQANYSKTFVGSGSKIQLYDEKSKLLDVVYLEVDGDLNGDGLVNATDQSTIQKIMMGRATVTYEKFLAGDLNRDGLINGVDLNLFTQIL